MKKMLVLLIAFTFISCNKEIKKSKFDRAEVQNMELHKDLYGFWVGDFNASEHKESDNFVYSNKINIVIKKIIGNKVYGQSIVAGNVNPFEGEFKSQNNGMYFTLKEFGKTKNDGVFTFAIQQDTLAGKWTSNDVNAIVTERTYKLWKQKFTYNPSVMLPKDGEPYVDYYNSKVDSVAYDSEDGQKEMSYDETYRTASDIITTINSSTTKLTEEDVKNLKKLELEILRNTIFARHGYSFKKKSFRQFFDPVAWYVPVSNDVTASLTSTEKSNIALLERFEKYAEDNYDSFGR